MPTVIITDHGFPAVDLQRKVIETAGFTLEEIKQLINLHGVVAALPKPLRRKPSELHGIGALGQERLQVINQKIRMLQNMRRQLMSMLKQLESPVVVSCPVSHETGALSTPPACPRKSS